MGERKLTLLALHFHTHGDVQVGPDEVNTGGRGSLGSRLGLGGQSSADADESGRRRGALPIPLAAGSVALLALAAVTWRTLRRR